MNITRLQALTLATAGCAVLFSSQGAAQAPAEIEFAAPRRIKAGDALLGEGRLYPSPVLHDVDGDGILDIVVGDLFGRVTTALGVSSQSWVFAAEEPFKDRSGEQLTFHNW